MTSIVYQDKCGGTMYLYLPKSERQKRTERILSALEDLKHMGNVNIFLLKRGKLRKIADRRW